MRTIYLSRLVQSLFSQQSDEEVERWLKQEIERLGVQLLSLRRLLASSSQTDRIYEVIFRDSNGQRYQTSCQVDWVANQIDWSDDPLELIKRNNLTADTNLDSPSPKERLAAVRQLATASQLSLESLQKLATLAVEDEDPQVREEAKAIVRDL